MFWNHISIQALKYEEVGNNNTKLGQQAYTSTFVQIGIKLTVSRSSWKFVETTSICSTEWYKQLQWLEHMFHLQVSTMYS